MHQTLHQVVSDCNVDGILLETHLSNFSTSVFLTLSEGTPKDNDLTVGHKRCRVKSLLVLESLPILILSSILLPDIVLASVNHEGKVALRVEAGGVVVQ